MRKLLIAGVGLFILIGLVALALVNLNGLINRNKAYLLAQTEKALGRKVAVGEVGVSLWPGIGVALKNVALAEDRAFAQGDFLRAESLQVNVKLLPLLWKELDVTRLILRKPVIRVIRDKRGAYNFASIGQAGEAGEATPGNAKERARERKSPQGIPLLASLVDVTDGEVYYQDRSAGIDLHVTRADLRVEDLGLDRPVSVSARVAALGAAEQNFTVKGTLGPLRSAQDLTGVPIKGDIEVNPLDLQAVGRALPLQGVLPAGLSVEGPLTVKARAEGTMQDLALTGEADATSSTVRWGDRFTKPKGVPLHLSMDARATEKAIALRTAKAQLHNLQLTGAGEIGRGKTPSVRLAVDSSRSTLEGWEKLLPALKGSDLSGTMELHARIQGELGQGRMPQVNGTLSLAGVRAILPSLPKPVTDLNAQLTFAGDRADLPETTLHLGNSQIQVAVQVLRFTPLAMSYRLAARELWLADLRAGGLGGKKPDVLRDVRGEGRIGTTGASITSQGRLTSASGTIADLEYTDLQTAVSFADQVLSIESLTARALDGSLQGNGRYDLRGPSPRFTFASRTQGLDLAQFLRAMFPAAPQNIRGKANLDLRLAGSGKTWEEIRPGLEGGGRAEVVNGALANVNVAEGVLSGVTGVPGLAGLIPPRARGKYPEIFAAQDTRFDQLKASLAVSQGKMRTEDLLIAAADYAVQGRGWVGLDGTLDTRAFLSLSRRLSDDIVTAVKEARYLLNEQGRLEVPFTLAGTLPRVKPQPDLAYVGRRLLERGALRKGEEELQKRLPQKFLRPEGQPAQPGEQKGPAESLRKGLERLFGR